MQRRAFLRRGGIGAAAVTATGAGCLDERIVEEVTDDSDDSDDADGADDSDGTDSDDATDDGTDAAPSIASEAIETTETTCATGEEADSEATVETGTDRVEIAGSLGAPNPCHAAVLSAVELAGDGAELAVEVGVEADDTDFCQECLGRIEYAATIEFDGGVPGTVTVTHAEIAGEGDVVEEADTEDAAVDDGPNE